MALRGWKRVRASVTTDVSFERFDSTAQSAIVFASRAAADAGHPTITTVHLACGLATSPLGEGLGISASLDDVRRGLDTHLVAPPAPVAPLQPRFDLETKQILVEAFVEADAGGSAEVGAEHLLLALLAHPGRGGGRALVDAGVDAAAMRVRWGGPRPVTALTVVSERRPDAEPERDLPVVRFDRLLPAAKLTIVVAQAYARASTRPAIGTDHLAGALTSDAVRVHLARSLPDGRAVERKLGLGVPSLDPDPSAAHVPFHDDMHEVIVTAFEVANAEDRVDIDAAHLLLALLDHPDTVGAQALTELGLDPSRDAASWRVDPATIEVPGASPQPRIGATDEPGGTGEV